MEIYYSLRESLSNFLSQDYAKIVLLIALVAILFFFPSEKPGE